RAVRHPPVLLDDDNPPILEVNEPDVGGALRWTAWSFVRDLGTRFVGGQVQPGDVPLRVFSIAEDRGAVEFGDGLRGLIPQRGPNNLRITYRSSAGGSAGNVAAGKLSLDTSLPNVDGIEQREAASGGVDEESAESAKGRAPDRIRSLERAVTALDFETLAEEKAGVARATAVNRRHPLVPRAPVTGAITLVVVPPRAGDEPAPMPSQLYLDEVARTLEPFRVLTTELFVVAPKYREVRVDVEIDVASIAAAATVRERVSDALSAYFDPIHGGDGRGWPLGGTIAYAEVLSTVLKVTDVGGVRSLTLNLDGASQPACSDVPLDDLDLLRPTGHKVRVNAPEVKR
ncbi:MAG TPA: baseplate J/gp47 family protein, partial [Polyangiaceae bacterium]|nr:baseplate J/gp47 family protein [Polyangiaceae bacterium]